MRPSVRASSQSESGFKRVVSKVGCVKKLEDRMRFIQSNQNITRAVTTVNGVQSLLRLHYAARCCSRRPCPSFPACPHAPTREHSALTHPLTPSHGGRQVARLEITLDVRRALLNLTAGVCIFLGDAVELVAS